MTWPVEASISTTEGADTESSAAAVLLSISVWGCVPVSVPACVPLSVPVSLPEGAAGSRDENSRVIDNRNDKIQRMA